ncbi:MAG TPA: PHP domain-containing protein [Rectinemataceae bacterium]|nr:PHP domain-containing protein [Rectinemataceae bacterium]
MKANLHLHSKFSDGSLWPEEIALGAAREGLEAAALTDHDTMGGTERFVRECSRLGLLGITACEIDVSEPEIDYKSEILGYFPGKSSTECPATLAMLAAVLGERKKRLEYYLYWARTIFRRDDLTMDDVLSDKLVGLDKDRIGDLDSVSWSKVDLFLYLKARRLIPTYTTYKIFKKEWFAPGKFPKYKLSKPGVRECVRSIHRDGGFAVIPHFGHFWNDDIDEMERRRDKISSQLGFFRNCGVDGIELYWYSGNKKTEAINGLVEEMAGKFGFFFTFGSDCHGPGTDKYTIDKFSGDFAGFPDVSR